MIYEQYKRYERRMDLLARIWKWIKKYYKTVILPPACALTLLFIFLALIGTVFGEIVCSDSVCGHAPEVDAYVFLAQPQYEYCSLDGGEWTENVPSEIGEYKMRIVAKNGYGKLKYSEETAFTVIPAELKFEYNLMTCVYGDEAKYLSEGIIMPTVVNGHNIQNIVFDFKYISDDRVKVSVQSFNVINKKRQGRYIILHSHSVKRRMGAA